MSEKYNIWLFFNNPRKNNEDYLIITHKKIIFVQHYFYYADTLRSCILSLHKVSMK